MIALRYVALATAGRRGVQRDVRRDEVGGLAEAASLLAAAREGSAPVIHGCALRLDPSSGSRRCLTLEVGALATIGIALRATCARAVWRALGQEDRSPAVPWVAVRHHGDELPWVDTLAVRLAWAAMEEE